jgi:thioredoxin-related protein
MKKILLALLLIFTVSILAQNTDKENIKFIRITQKKCSKQKGNQLVLKQVLTDSRCPQGVTCVWAGEVTAVVSVYKDSKFIEDYTMVFSMKKEQENIKWLAGYLPEKQKNIKSISVFPYPKSGRTINTKDYYIKIGYIK